MRGAQQLGVKQFVAEVNGRFGFRFRVFTTRTSGSWCAVPIYSPRCAAHWPTGQDTPLALPPRVDMHDPGG